MTLSYYMDQHVSAAVTQGLRRRGIDVLTAYEDAASRLEDSDLLTRASALKRVLYTQDQDFLRIVAEWQKEQRHFTGVIYAHQLAISVGQTIEDLELIAHGSSPEEMENRIEFLPL